MHGPMFPAIVVSVVAALLQLKTVESACAVGAVCALKPVLLRGPLLGIMRRMRTLLDVLPLSLPALLRPGEGSGAWTSAAAGAAAAAAAAAAGGAGPAPATAAPAGELGPGTDTRGGGGGGSGAPGAGMPGQRAASGKQGWPGGAAGMGRAGSGGAGSGGDGSRSPAVLLCGLRLPETLAPGIADLQDSQARGRARACARRAALQGVHSVVSRRS